MSEDNNVNETVQTEEAETKKQKRSKEDILEIIIAVFLGITALATAWASWIGSLHGGNMSTNYTKSNNLAADGNSRWNEASQSLMQDMQIWNMISDYQVEILYAMQTQNEDQMYESAYKIQFICTDNLTNKMAELIGYDFNFDADGIIDWVSNGEAATTSPFANDEFIESYYADALTIKAVLGEVSLDVADILNLQVDDIIPLDKSINSNVVLKIEGRPWFDGKLGIFNQNKAVKIENVYRIEV